MSQVIFHSCTLSRVCTKTAGELTLNKTETDFHFNFRSWHGSEFHPEVISLRRMIDGAKEINPQLVKKVLQEALKVL